MNGSFKKKIDLIFANATHPCSRSDVKVAKRSREIQKREGQQFMAREQELSQINFRQEFSQLNFTQEFLQINFRQKFSQIKFQQEFSQLNFREEFLS